MCLTDYEITNIITSKKIISKPPKKIMSLTGSSLKNDMELTNIEANEHFSVFMGQSHLIPSNFSIGLIWKNLSVKKEIILIRYNGPHGGNLKCTSHFVPHVHIYTADAFEKELYKPTTLSNEPVLYTTFDEALMHFCYYCGIEEAYKYFPYIAQQSLF